MNCQLPAIYVKFFFFRGIHIGQQDLHFFTCIFLTPKSSSFREENKYKYQSHGKMPLRYLELFDVLISISLLLKWYRVKVLTFSKKVSYNDYYVGKKMPIAAILCFYLKPFVCTSEQRRQTDWLLVMKKQTQIQSGRKNS